MNGRFIVIEGQGFTGKTTQANLLVSRLKEKGIEAVSVRHPGGTIVAEKYRRELLQKKNQGVLTPDEELELILKALHSLVDELILPTLEKGTWVVLTRFIASTIVYQGYQEGLDKDFIRQQAEKASQHLKPDLSILIDLSEEEIMRRQSKAQDSEIHAYNNSDPKVLKIRRDGFLEVFDDMENTLIIKGDRSKEEIGNEIYKEVNNLRT